MKLYCLVSKLFVVIFITIWLSGCAQVMVMRQPSPYTPTTLTAGSSRNMLVAELGPPISSETYSSGRQEVFKYTDGGGKNHGAVKFIRLAGYTVGDLFTLWLDQVIWMPLEKYAFSGKDHVVTVQYNQPNDGPLRVKSVDDKIIAGRSKEKEAF